MNLFKCSHEINREDMKNLTIKPSEYFDGWSAKGALLKYTGVCYKCHCFVSLKEEVTSLALFEYLKRENVK